MRYRRKRQNENETGCNNEQTRARESVTDKYLGTSSVSVEGCRGSVTPWHSRLLADP